ncbi:MAG: serine hydrolase [Syntrophaceae bacterium]|jgi:CubicO group peptidase (beta-lactamase class C family)|nr:serine hydrolase [Syntrophaceae bacterium]
MRRTKTLLLSLFLPLVFSVLCTEAIALTRYSLPGKFVNVFPAFSVTYPKEWNRTTLPSPFVFEAAKPEGFPLMRIFSLPDMGMALNDFSKIYVSAISEFGKEAKIISDKGAKLKDGSLIQETEIEWVDHSGTRINTFFLTARKEGIAITVGISDNKGKVSKALKSIAYSLDFPSGQEGKKAPVTYQYKVPVQTNDGWPTAHMAEVNMDEKKPSRLIEKILDGTYKDVHSVLIFKNGKLVLEEYFPGFDIEKGSVDYGREKMHVMMSVTKSFGSTLMGIAIDKGLVKGVDEYLSSFFPNYARYFNDINKKKIKLRHVLSMSAGFDWVDLEFYGAVIDTESCLDYIFSKSMAHEPGSTFNYNSGLSILVGKIILDNSRPLKFEEFADQYLFRPLGIKKYEWDSSYVDRSGEVIPRTDVGLNLYPRDMARLGYLYINKGKWNGQQIVSPQWIEEATREQVKYHTVGYGYQWWLYQYRVNDFIVKAHVADGYGGQRIIVIPDLDMVIVFTAGMYSNGVSHVVNLMYSMAGEYIVAAVKAKGVAKPDQ